MDGAAPIGQRLGSEVGLRMKVKVEMVRWPPRPSSSLNHWLMSSLTAGIYSTSPQPSHHGRDNSWQTDFTDTWAVLHAILIISDLLSKHVVKEATKHSGLSREEVTTEGRKLRQQLLHNSNLRGKCVSRYTRHIQYIVLHTYFALYILSEHIKTFLMTQHE